MVTEGGVGDVGPTASLIKVTIDCESTQGPPDKEKRVRFFQEKQRTVESHEFLNPSVGDGLLHQLKNCVTK